jgi:hypothetical protein
MYRSKATVTEEEDKEIARLHKIASGTPVLLIGGIDVASDAWRRLHDYIDELARKHGLADQPGEWGYDAQTRQFLSDYRIVEEG